MQIPIVIPSHIHHPRLPVTDPMIAPMISPDTSPMANARSRLLKVLLAVLVMNSDYLSWESCANGQMVRTCSDSLLLYSDTSLIECDQLQL